MRQLRVSCGGLHDLLLFNNTHSSGGRDGIRTHINTATTVFYACGLGPVNTLFANANGVKTAPVKARDDAQTGRLGWERNAEWRRFHPIASGLRSKRPCAALQSLDGVCPACVCALLKAFLTRNASCKQSVNRP